MQEHWIGRSEGVNLSFPYELEGTPKLLRVYTTRPDTLMGVSFVAIAAEHPLAAYVSRNRPDLQAFIEECWTERLREFPLEMKIWDDCVRTGKFPQISATNKGEVQFVDLIGAKNGSGATFKATDLYWPIPVNEIQRNPNLTQNEGYSAK